MKSKDSIIVIGLEDRKLGVVPTEKVGKCVICDKPVYLSALGVDFELTIQEFKKIKGVRLLGMPCVIEMIKMFNQVMQTPRDQRKRIKDELLRRQGVEPDEN